MGCIVVFAVGLLGGRGAQVTSENQKCDGRLIRNRAERKTFKSDICPKDDPMSLYPIVPHIPPGREEGKGKREYRGGMRDEGEG